MEAVFLHPAAPTGLVKSENGFICAAPISSYECCKCPNFQTDSLTNLMLHVQSNHHKQPLKHKKRPYKCPKCGFTSHSRYLLIRHCLLESKRPNCQLCDYTSTQSDLSLHILTTHMKPFRRKKKKATKKIIRQVQCELCPYKVRWTCELRSHVLAKHTPLDEIKWLHCDLCSSKFKLKKYLRQHVRDRHVKNNKEITWSQCEHCPYKCKRKSELKMHVLRKHTSDNEIVWYWCDQCLYRTKEKKRLNEHVALKHGVRVKKFQCNSCTYKAMWSYEMKRHIAAKHL